MKTKGLFKTKKRIVMYGGAFFIVLLAAALYLQLPVSPTDTDDPYNSGSPKTDIQPISDIDIWDPSGPTIAPTPTPTQDTWNPTGPTTQPQPTATQAPRESIKVWQTLYWTDTNNNGHWVNAPKPFSLASIFGGTGTDFKIVKLLQNNIYLNIPSSAVSPHTVVYYRFHCQETIKLQDANGNYIATIADSQPIDTQGTSPTQDSNVWVTGASLDPAQFQSIIASKVGRGSYNFVIELRDITLTVTLSNGNTHILHATSGSNSENTLVWPIKYI